MHISHLGIENQTKITGTEISETEKIGSCSVPEEPNLAGQFGSWARLTEGTEISAHDTLTAQIESSPTQKPETLINFLVT